MILWFPAGCAKYPQAASAVENSVLDMWDDLPLDPTAETWQNDSGSRPSERMKIQGMLPS